MLEYITHHVESSVVQGTQLWLAGEPAFNYDNIPRHAPSTPLRVIEHAAIGMAEPAVIILHMSSLGKDAVSWLEVGEDSAGQRVDNFLVKMCKGVPKQSHLSHFA